MSRKKPKVPVGKLTPPGPVKAKSKPDGDAPAPKKKGKR
jgi:hypothetical protein